MSPLKQPPQTSLPHDEEFNRRISEKQFRSLFDHILNGVVHCRIIFEENDPADFVYLRVNAGFERLTGLGDVIGRKASEVIPGIRKANPELFETCGRVVNTDIPERLETYIEALGHWFSVSVYSTGKKHFFMVFDAITERKRMEEELRELSQRLSYHVDYSPLAVIEWGPDMRLIRWSGEAEHLFGWRAEEVLGKRMEDFRWVYEEDKVQVAEVSLDLTTGTNKNRFSVNRNYRKDGTLVHCEWYNSSLLDDSGKFRSILSLVLDVTGRKKMEDELRRSEAEFRLLSETAGNLLTSENPQGIVDELCRKVMAHLDCHVFFNFLLDENTGKFHLNAYGGISEQEARELERANSGGPLCDCVAREGRRVIAEDIFNRPDIGSHLLRSYGIRAFACHPLKAGGRVIGTLSFGTKTRLNFSSRDLAVMKNVADEAAVAMERIRLIEGLRKSKDELELRVEERTAELKKYMAKLEESNQALQDFAFIASHDMQEPLRKVISFGNMLSKEYMDRLGERGNDYLRRMLGATRRMQSLLKALLEYSRVTAKTDPFVDVDLKQIVDDVLSDLEVMIERAAGQVHVGELPVVQADPTQMGQLFQNLIGNALKFHKKDEKPVVGIRSAAADGKLEIVVEDKGIGFDERHLDRILAPFQRLHGRTEYEGAGMGLAICKRIVERHGWRLTAKSAPGKGASFIILLPLNSSTNIPDRQRVSKQIFAQTG